ncbi:MAG: hypothetical protein J0L92_23665 [Deltaproteobacteria bacterium]|nr:hypothetical protein [Deltaproteobacteria bacterium]
MTNELSMSKRQHALALAWVVCTAATWPSAARADLDRPLPHDACGADGGPSVQADAGPEGAYVFADPIAAPAQGARFEPSCSANVATRGETGLGWTLSFGALAWLARRRRERARARDIAA